ncbi:hypothetical protein SPRG_09732 [Saprolegnia parasitica CBS 223.65]|uniref:Uncharacterized protein n=1 Tax=Saprolegnia parasitica (strain CBS 223.65) TaxID=695850 RepID=A0A067CDV0_SAPPC|nr:hypothetical protein SPRG_09732 [Saprolegnia parasitica CBS 223.65]KDO25002.1 hypothetical protein SPRG_09732 [Saprolegnia parasitica CBS 223.65]|eukprot:XP_012204271.1 hypothetical protein SPRG_09732 [Saprolegnia parasitica CBS 223.65]
MLTAHRRKSVIVQQMADFVPVTELPDDVHWWEARARVVQEWLRANPLRIGLPDDGTIETITQQLARGDKYIHVRVKAWNHIVTELQGIPGVCEKFATFETSPELPMATVVVDDDDDNEQASHASSPLSDTTTDEPAQIDGVVSLHPASPFRGKLHPTKAKSLHEPADVSVLATNQTDKPDAPRKSMGQMSMMERQEEWLRKKAEKAAAEKQRQLDEAEKELTFQPSLVKKPKAPDTDGASSPRKLQRSKSAGRARKSAALSKDKSIVMLKPGAKSATSKSLLDSVKSELAASTSIPVKTLTTTTTTSAKLDVAAVAERTDATIAYVAAALDTINKTTLTPSVVVTKDAPKGDVDVRVSQFDALSSDVKGRFQLQDPALFDLTSIYRKKDKYARVDGVCLQMGRRDDTHDEQLIAVLFDRDKFTSEAMAQAWFNDHKARLQSYM